jgi:glutamyl-tRNA synthetase
VRGRFAPSPTGSLHLGNLRTALVAWLMARSAGGEFIVRMEDLDRVTSSRQHEADQLESLREIGVDWDGDVVRQSERFDLYQQAVEELRARGRVYECYCTRREIRQAASAPHGLDADKAYPGTCRHLTRHQRDEFESAGRRPALRLRADATVFAFDDLIVGRFAELADDVVIQRNDGVPAYNLAVVIDDADQAVTDIVRGDDLLSSTPRQLMIQQLLALPAPRYAHVPLVVAPDGTRLAKRHGAVTLADLAGRGHSPGEVCARLAMSLGIDTNEQAVTAGDLLDHFDVNRIPQRPWVLDAAEL